MEFLDFSSVQDMYGYAHSFAGRRPEPASARLVFCVDAARRSDLGMAGARRKGRCLPPAGPAPRWSSCVYVRLDPSLTGLFRFLLEAEENLGYMRVVDRWEAVLQVVFAPQQAKDLFLCLEDMREMLPFTVLFLPSGP
jgi:hypothetical protein